jgi:hypothetical protein
MTLPTPHTLEVNVTHPSLNELQILHLSDLHIDKKTLNKSLENLIDISSKLLFDFTVITGDIIDCKVKYIHEKLKILNTLAYIKPVYFISGNHDVVYGLEELKKELSNFIFLDNDFILIDFNNHKICLVGLADRFAKFFKVQRDEIKVKDILNRYDATILISHQPKDYKIAVETKTPLFLCGHTHGGQIFPFHYLVKLVQPFLAGLFYKNETAIYVNKGLGTWGINYRYKADCEITILKLISKSVKYTKGIK